MFKEEARRRREVVIFNPKGWISVLIMRMEGILTVSKVWSVVWE
jgi:hypothetical protein